MKRRRIVLGLADQAVIALANAGNGLLATAVLPRSVAGSVLISITTLFFTIGLSRAFIGEALLAHVSRFDGADRRSREQDALAAALAAGLLGAVVLLGLWAFGPHAWFGGLIWVLPFLPLMLVQDTGRFSYLAARRQFDALVIDSTWVGAQAAVVAGCWLAGWRTGGMLLLAWGVGATAGGVLFLVRSRLNPFRGRVGAWIAETRHLSGWFTGTAVIGQSQTLLVGLIVSKFLTEVAYAGLRFAQLVVLQPVQNLISAMMGLLVPRFSRLAAAGDHAGIQRLTRKIALLGLGLGALVVVAAVLFAHPVLNWWSGGTYRDVASIALPVALQAGIYLLQIPFTAALRGMQRPKLLFAQYALFTATSLTGLTLGARDGSLAGAAWGLTTGAGVGLVAMIASYAVALRTATPATRECTTVPPS